MTHWKNDRALEALSEPIRRGEFTIRQKFLAMFNIKGISIWDKHTF